MSDKFEQWFESEFPDAEEFWLIERPTMNLIEQLEKLPRTRMYNHERQDGSDEAVCTYVKLSDLRAIIEQAKLEAVEPVAYVKYTTKEWFGKGNGLGGFSYVKNEDYKYPLYTAPQPDHTKLIGELVDALEGLYKFASAKSTKVDALLTKAREAIK